MLHTQNKQKLGENCGLKEKRMLNRIITLTDERVLYEADPRHHELMTSNLGLEHGKRAVTPGIKPVDLECKATKDGAPEPWDDSAWQNEEHKQICEEQTARRNAQLQHSSRSSISASVIDLKHYEAEQ